MAVYKCLVSGTTMEVHTALDIESMDKHPGYALVEEGIEEDVVDDIVVTKKKSKKKNQEL